MSVIYCSRVASTRIVFVVAVAVYLLTARRGNPARLSEAIARTLDAVAATLTPYWAGRSHDDASPVGQA